MRDDDNDGDGGGESGMSSSLLPYEQWIEQAYRQVMVKALAHAAAEGLPGAHHFYITFRTTARGVQIPTRLLAQYPQEMTIVLQHQFWDLKVDEQAGTVSVGLSFGSVPATLLIPFAAVTGFADPHVRLVLPFTLAEEEARDGAAAPAPAPVVPAPVPAPSPAPAEQETEASPAAASEEAPQVVSLDAFRRRGPTNS